LFFYFNKVMDDIYNLLILILLFAFLNICINKRKTTVITLVNENLKKQLIQNSLQNLKLMKDNTPDFQEEAILYNLINDFKDNSDYSILLQVGNIYQKGIYPRYRCNKEMASECYKIAARCHLPEIASLGQLKYMENYNDTILEIDNIGKEIPEIYGVELCILAKEYIDNTPYNFFSIKPKHQDTFEPISTIQANYALIPIQNNVVEYVNNDFQNVHDHAVSNIIKTNINELKKNTIHQNPTQNEIDINEALIKATNKILENPYLSENEKGNALLVVKSLDDKKHLGYNVSEKEALKITMDKINNMNSNKDNLIEILGKQLASGIESGNIVCSTGKIARIIGTFDGTDADLSSVRPITAIRNEIATLAAKHRDSKETFKKITNDTYIQKLNMSPDIINGIVNEYIEHM